MQPSAEELVRTIEAGLGSAGLDLETVERHPGSTIVPSAARIDTDVHRALEWMSERTVTPDAQLELHGTIGQGGMGIVRLGTQHSVGREVAVKTLRPEHRNERSILKLVREAWVTGRLEHPNVVPVYDVVRADDGAPLIVLKKIEGVDWASVMHDAAALRERFGAIDPIEWNLRTLLAVCNAVRFAHSRGVLHRDLKPENVMIGPFGEVYVVDWGIAVALSDDGSGRLPLAADAREMAGTPLYMAPEMLGGNTSRLSIASDVYLLGAILYEIATGRPPHRGQRLMEIVSSILASDPPIADDVPPELARIIRRAMAPEPEHRFPDAQALRLALDDHLRHRDASRLADRAHQRLLDLSAALAGDADRETIYHLFGECRFGFRHALEVWPDNDDALRALDRAILAMIEFELAQGEPEAARALLAEMEEAPAALTERIEASRRAKEREQAELRRLSADLDPSRGRRTRVFLSAVLAVMWTLLPLASGIAARSGYPSSPRALAISSALFLVLLTALGTWARQSVMATAINRRLGFAALLVVSLQLLASLAGIVRAAPAETLVHANTFMWTAVAGMLGAAVDRRLFVPAATYLAVFLVGPSLDAASLWFCIAFANAVLLVTTVVLWARPAEDFVRVSARIRQRSRRRAQ